VLTGGSVDAATEVTAVTCVMGVGEGSRGVGLGKGVAVTGGVIVGVGVRLGVGVKVGV
jgi:hypothetical protein